jgi:hypothetical protein
MNLSSFLVLLFHVTNCLVVDGVVDKKDKKVCSDHLYKKTYSRYISGETYETNPRNQDPRLSDKCRRVFGSSNTNISIVTVEDVIAKQVNENPRIQKCSMLHPYGFFAVPIHPDGGQGILYVEIPKTGTTTMKQWLPSCRHP